MYRCYDGRGRLLYIGISVVTLCRMIEHRQQPWWVEVARVDVEHLGVASRREAEVVERAAILAEQPLFNLAGKRPVGPPQQRLGTSRPNGAGSVVRRNEDVYVLRVSHFGGRRSRNVRRVMVNGERWETEQEFRNRAELELRQFFADLGLTIRERSGAYKTGKGYVGACRRGHPRTPENTYLWKDIRYCRVCQRMWWEKQRKA